MIEIINKRDCCGCSACVNACPKKCISMQEDLEGFLYPVVDKNVCVDCGLCEKVCPIKSGNVVCNSFSQKAYVAQNRNESILKESTSGGVFSAIAKRFIAEGGIVFGAGFNKCFEVEHLGVEKEDDLKLFRNSKYVQSRLGTVFCQVKKHLEENRLVLFSGTGCQLEGLFHYLKKNYSNLYTIDVVCRAVPSPLVLRKYLDMQQSRGLAINDVKFRDKYYGYKYSTMSLYTSNGRNYHEGIDTDAYLRAFFSGLSIRPSCMSCKFRQQHRRTDMTIWDCFTIDEFCKEFDNDKGATRIITHSNRAEMLIRNASKDLNVVEVDVNDAVKGVKELVESPKEHPLRSAFFEDLNRMPAEKVFAKYLPNTLRHRLEKHARLWSCRLGIYKIMKKIFKRINGAREIKR